MEILNNTPFPVTTLCYQGPVGKNSLTVIIKGTFEIRPGERAAVASEQIPVTYGDEFHDNLPGGSVKFESDIVPFKPRADIVLVGKAHAPNGRPVQGLDIMLWVGQIKKIIRVFGDRHWICPSKMMPERPSKPIPFTTMDLVYERAFGGIDMAGGGWCKENLIGVGFFAKKSKKILDGAPLPNLEDPRNLIKSWKDHPKPAGFGFYGKAWMPRAGYMGTYDEKWREEGSPEPPKDFRFDYFNGAHPDLQLEGYLKGDEEVELLNFVPEGKIRFWLPGISLTCEVAKSLEQIAESTSKSDDDEGEDFEGPDVDYEFEEEDEEWFEDVDMDDEFEDEGLEDFLDADEEMEEAKETPTTTEHIDLNLDTLCLIPDEKRFYLVWRGLYPINDLSANEISTIEIM
jgi:hypothetical protein